jgi:hypothetical protein
VVGVLGPLERTVHRFVRSAGQTVRLSELGDGKNSDIDTDKASESPGEPFFPFCARFWFLGGAP